MGEKNAEERAAARGGLCSCGGNGGREMGHGAGACKREHKGKKGAGHEQKGNTEKKGVGYVQNGEKAGERKTGVKAAQKKPPRNDMHPKSWTAFGGAYFYVKKEEIQHKVLARV